MRKHNMSAPVSAQKGVVIIEALVAILIFSVGVLGIVGMQANMVKNTSESKYRADAGYIAQQIIGGFWSHPDNLPPDGGPPTTEANIAALGITDIDMASVTTMLPNGTLLVERTGDRYDVTITWQQPGEAPHNFVTSASIPTVN